MNSLFSKSSNSLTRLEQESSSPTISYSRFLNCFLEQVAAVFRTKVLDFDFFPLNWFQRIRWKNLRRKKWGRIEWSCKSTLFHRVGWRYEKMRVSDFSAITTIQIFIVSLLVLLCLFQRSKNYMQKGKLKIRRQNRRISPWLENHLKKTKNRSLIPIYKEYLNDSFNLYGLEPNGVSLASVMDIITGKQIFDGIYYLWRW